MKRPADHDVFRKSGRESEIGERAVAPPCVWSLLAAQVPLDRGDEEELVLAVACVHSLAILAVSRTNIRKGGPRQTADSAAAPEILNAVAQIELAARIRAAEISPTRVLPSLVEFASPTPPVQFAFSAIVRHSSLETLEAVTRQWNSTAFSSLVPANAASLISIARRHPSPHSALGCVPHRGSHVDSDMEDDSAAAAAAAAPSSPSPPASYGSGSASSTGKAIPWKQLESVIRSRVGLGVGVRVATESQSAAAAAASTASAPTELSPPDGDTTPMQALAARLGGDFVSIEAGSLVPGGTRGRVLGPHSSVERILFESMHRLSASSSSGSPYVASNADGGTTTPSSRPSSIAIDYSRPISAWGHSNSSVSGVAPWEIITPPAACGAFSSSSHNSSSAAAAWRPIASISATALGAPSVLITSAAAAVGGGGGGGRSRHSSGSGEMQPSAHNFSFSGGSDAMMSPIADSGAAVGSSLCGFGGTAHDFSSASLAGSSSFSSSSSFSTSFGVSNSSSISSFSSNSSSFGGGGSAYLTRNPSLRIESLDARSSPAHTMAPAQPPPSAFFSPSRGDGVLATVAQNSRHAFEVEGSLFAAAAASSPASASPTMSNASSAASSIGFYLSPESLNDVHAKHLKQQQALRNSRASIPAPNSA